MISKAYKALVGDDVKFELTGTTLDGVVWLDERPQPSDADVQAKIDEFEAAEPMRLLREERNRKLAETDWWASSDLTMTQAQTDYRQALRDITSSATSLEDVTWPEKP